MIRESRGVYFTREQAQIFRSLNRVEGEVRPPETFKDEGERRRFRPHHRCRRLRDNGPLPSMGGGTLIRRLVARAEAAVAQGRPAQARSDLSTARSLMPGVDPDRNLLRPVAAGE